MLHPNGKLVVVDHETHVTNSVRPLPLRPCQNHRHFHKRLENFPGFYEPRHLLRGGIFIFIYDYLIMQLLC